MLKRKDNMIAPIFIVVSILTCFSVFVLVKTLCRQSYDEGFAQGYKDGTYDALKTDLQASKTAFPHKS